MWVFRGDGVGGGALGMLFLDSNSNTNPILRKTALEKASFGFYSKKLGYSAI
jgi:hypothetical protein